jgi:AbrB family looped-hinge helix DNA binding protein
MLIALPGKSIPPLCVIILLESYQVETTRLSTKGRIILPKAVRTSRAWGPGTEFTIEETGDGILLRPAATFPETELDDVAGCLRSKRQSTLARTLAQMDVGTDGRCHHTRGDSPP